LFNDKNDKEEIDFYKRSKKTWVFTFFVIAVLLALTLSISFTGGKEYDRLDTTVRGFDLTLVLEAGESTDTLKSKALDVFEGVLDDFNNDRLIPEEPLNAGERLSVSDSTLELIKRLYEISVYTGGLYDFTLGNLKALHDSKGEIPVKERDQALDRCGYFNVEITDDMVRLHQSVRLYLKPVAVAYAMDRAVAAIKEMDEKQTGYLMVDGDIAIIGARNGNVPWSCSFVSENDNFLFLKDGALLQGPVRTINPINGKIQESNFNRGFVLTGSALLSRTILIAVSFLSEKEAEDFLTQRSINAGLLYDERALFTARAEELFYNDNDITF